jgi:hypothetical protein
MLRGLTLTAASPVGPRSASAHPKPTMIILIEGASQIDRGRLDARVRPALASTRRGHSAHHRAAQGGPSRSTLPPACPAQHGVL